MSFQFDHVLNIDSIIRWFGYWPDFHDFEIVRVDKDRSYSFITIQIYGFNTGQGADRAGYKMAKECIITLKFNEIADEILMDIERQNVLARLAFRDEGQLLKTEFWASPDRYCYIVSKNVEVLSIKSAC